MAGYKYNCYAGELKMKLLSQRLKVLNEGNLSKTDIDIIDSIEFDNKDIIKLKNLIIRYHNLNIDFNILKENWKDIAKITTHNSSSLEIFQLRYGMEKGKELFDKKSKESSIDKEKFISIYGEEEANKLLRLRGASLEIYIERYGKEDGIIKWNEYCKKRAKTFESKRGKGIYASRNLEWFIKKYGEKLGLEIWNKKKNSQAYNVSTNGYIEKYGEEEGKRLIKLSKSRGLEFYIKKYGIIDGMKKFQDKNIRCQQGRARFSKWAIECIEECKKTIPDLLFYGKNEMIWALSIEWQDKLKQRIILPDLFYKGKIIEFQGDLFHANPTMFSESDNPHPKQKHLTANDIWNQDNLRIKYYQSKGYNVIEIWENDFYNKREEVINQCINFLK